MQNLFLKMQFYYKKLKIRLNILDIFKWIEFNFIINKCNFFEYH